MHKKYFVGTSILVAVFVVTFNQVTKYIITTAVEIGDSFEATLHFLDITLHRNNDAAWGILSGKMTFFFIITIIILVTLVYFFIRDAQYNLFMQVAISLLFAGAPGNFIDRILTGKVVDFVDTNIFGYDFPIFNIVDSSLTIGVTLIITALLKGTSNKRGKEVK